MLPIIFCVLFVLIALFVVAILTRPPTFTVRRSRLIAAPPEQVFAQVVDFWAWIAWSPWEGLDPHSSRTFGTVTAGPGATYGWAGNRKVGAGRMTISNVRVHENIGIDIEFFRPFKAKNVVSFQFAASNAGTTVTWTMQGKNTVMGKVMSLVIDCDKLIGGPFDQGLASLAKICESPGRAST